MKKAIFTLAIIMSFTLAQGQVGIGTTTPRGALEVSNTTNGGVVIPSYALTGSNDVSTVTNLQTGGAPVTGTLIYNTNAVTGANAIAVGYVFWDGSTWTEVTPAASSGSGWSLAGNATTGTEFVGTTNFNSLELRTNNSQAGRFHPNGGIALGIGAAANDNNSLAVGTGAQATTSNEATAVGRSANASGFQATAVGYQAAASANNTAAVGHSATASGFQASAFGHNTTASNNNAVAVGASTTASGLNSAAFGNTADASGQNATAIGFGATAPNATTIILGNTDTNAANFGASKIGIGTSNPTAKLQVNGSIRYVDGNQAAGRVLTSDANGNATWASATTVTPVYGEVYRNSDRNNIALNTALIFDNNGPNSGTTLNNNGITTGPAGVYRITYTVSMEQQGSGGSQEVEFFLRQGSTEIPGSRTYIDVSNNPDYISVTKSTLVNITSANQTVGIYPDQTNNNVIILSGTSLSLELID